MTHTLVYLLASIVVCVNNIKPVEIPVIHADKHKIKVEWKEVDDD